MTIEAPVLGKLIDGSAFRDAIHVAVAPVTAGEQLHPGDHVGLNQQGEAVSAGVEFIGIVDPFLTCLDVEPGQRFWLLLYPGTVVGLRHSWSHRAFATKIPPAPVSPPDESESLRKEIAKLKAELDVARLERDDAEEAASNARCGC